MKEPKVTILITAKNSAKTIKNCIESLIKIDYHNYDILIVEAYSSDNTYEILNGYKNCPSVKIIRKEGWAPVAFNSVLDEIDSEYTAFTDADCIVERNWLKELIKGFTENDVVATAGFCGTQQTENILQKIIGMELEHRFNNFPKYISRAPTMNFCIKTDLLKRLRFDEKFKVAFETDFGYRLIQFGKIVYIKETIVYHHHRSSWKSFFFQQRLYATYHFLISMKYRGTILGDHISNPYMVLQVPIFGIFLLSMLLSQILNYRFLYLAIACFSNILTGFFIKFQDIRIGRKNIVMFLEFSIIRMIAWFLGVFIGLSKYIREPKKWSGSRS